MGTRNPVLKTVTLLLFVSLLVGCGSTAPEPVTVKETVISEVPVTVEVTRVVEVTSEVADRSQPAASAMEATIPGSPVSMLLSSSSDREYKIFVALPVSYSKYDRKTYPVVYLTDGNFYLDLVTEMSHLYHFFEKQLPELIIVGIGYDIDWKTEGRLDKFIPLRVRDLTPPQMSSSPGSGEAGEFLRFIQEDLIPHIDANYRTDPTDRTIVGHSHGGLFSLYALFHAPETFTRYVAASPSLWWDDRVMFEYEEEFANEHADLPVKLFLSVGALEEKADISSGYVSNLEELHRRLEDRNYAGLDMEMVIFEDETHSSVLPGAFSKGLLTVFR